MIEFVTGDILKAEAEALVNTVNCVGYMGRGIAGQFKRAFPENFKAYEIACKRGELKPGAMLFFETGRLTNPRYIVNFPTKRHWRGKSRLEDIDAGLEALTREIQERKIKSIAIPPLGCGLGGLTWNDVKPRIERALGALNEVTVIVFEPSQVPAASADNSRSREVPRMTPGRAVLIKLIERYLAGGLMQPFITLLEVHKLMYFAQEAGEQLRLTYLKETYGPYAENLRHVLSKIEGHFVSGYADGGDAPDKQLSLVPGAIEDAQACLAKNSETLQRFERVDSLLEGFETPFGMELLATVHWVLARENVTSENDLEKAVYSWSMHKQRFTPRQIQLAAQRLKDQGWIQGPIA